MCECQVLCRHFVLTIVICLLSVKKHKSQFDSLIKEARNRMKNKRVTAASASVSCTMGNQPESEHKDDKSRNEQSFHLGGNSAVEGNTDGQRSEQIRSDKHDVKDCLVKVDRISSCNDSNRTTRARSNHEIENSSDAKQKRRLTSTVSIEDCSERTNRESENQNLKNILQFPEHLLSPRSEIIFALPSELASPRNSAKVNRHAKAANETSHTACGEGIQEAGLSCDVTSLTKMRHSVSLSGSPSKHVFVDDSASEAGSEVGLIQKINSSISKSEQIYSFQIMAVDNRKRT